MGVVQRFIGEAVGTVESKSPPKNHAPSGFQAGFLKNRDGSLGKKWPLVTCGFGCAISPGCKNCPGRKLQQPIRCVASQLLEPTKWKTPKVVFVCNEGDLFHKSVPAEYIALALSVMESCPDHRFILLTKRAERMASLLSDHRFLLMVSEVGSRLMESSYQNWGEHFGHNILVGVSVEDQEHMDRVAVLPHLPEAMTKIMFAAPQLTHIDLGPSRGHLEWVVSSGERSCKKPRPCRLEWQLDLAMQCKDAEIPFFLERRLHSAWVGKAGNDRHLEYPEVLGNVLA